MHKGRLEAFSDGVLAIIITIMVLELKVPHGDTFADLQPLLPVFLSYVLSFVFVGIYWNNHHHMLQAAHQVNGAVLWANMHLLLWLSFIPAVTHWLGETNFAPAPVALYGVVLFGSAIAYYLLARLLVRLHGERSALAVAIGSDTKGRFSLVVYLVAIGVALVAPAVSCLLYVTVAVLWLAPDRRIERVLVHPTDPEHHHHD